MILSGLRELWQYRELLVTLASRDVKVRYKQTVLGVLWATAQPLAMMLVFTLVFQYIFGAGRDVTQAGGAYPYQVVNFVALVPWLFTQQVLNTGIMSLVGNMNLVTRIYFPREILPLSVAGIAGVDMLCGWGVFAGLMWWYDIAPPLTMFWFPVILAVHAAFSFSLALFAAALNVFYRDVRYAVTLALFLGMFLAPVTYPLSLVPVAWTGALADFAWMGAVSPRDLYLLNPMAGILESYREALLYGTFNGGLLVYPAVFSLVAGVGAYAGFKHFEPRFAEVI